MKTGRWSYRYDPEQGGVTILRFIRPHIWSEAERVEVPAELDGHPVVRIGRSAFRMSGVTEVILPEGIVEIGLRAFGLCTGLKKINLPESLREIGSEAFYYCGSLKTVRIPKNVRFIAPQAFGDCEQLSEVILPEGLEVIGKGAFWACIRLEKVLPERLPNLKEIQDSAFRGCHRLMRFFLGKNVEKIGDDAFRACGWLTLTVAEGSAAEAYCRKYTLRHEILTRDGEIVIPEPMAPWSECDFEEKEDGTVRITRYRGDNERFEVPGEIEGKTVTEIGKEAFKFTGPKSVIIPDSVEIIGEAAFDMCNLFEIRLGKGVKEIGKHAFLMCRYLKRVEGIGPALRKIGEGAFMRCGWLREFDFTEGLEEIGPEAFAFTALESADLREGTLSVGERAFEGCQALREVTVPEGFRTLGDEAFRYCWNLERIEIRAADCEIGTAVFNGCTGLKEICLKEHHRLYVQNGMLIDRQEKRVIAYCTGREEALCTVPKETESIGAKVFRKARMERAVLPEGVKEIGDYAFEACESLQNIQLPDSLRVIGKGAFDSCKSLVWIVIPDGVEEIREWAFNSCESMKRLRIPTGVKLIERGVFGYGGCKPVCVVTKGSYAEQYCLENGLETEYESQGD